MDRRETAVHAIDRANQALLNGCAVETVIHTAQALVETQRHWGQSRVEWLLDNGTRRFLEEHGIHDEQLIRLLGTAARRNPWLESDAIAQLPQLETVLQILASFWNHTPSPAWQHAEELA